jgi:hypothetical protein
MFQLHGGGVTPTAGSDADMTIDGSTQFIQEA